FEAFSRDESTYARLTLRANAFDAVERSMPGSTNVDFSRGLRTGIERLRSGSPTSLIVEDSGIEVRSRGRVDRIELPDGWVHGFLAVHSSMRVAGSRCALRPWPRPLRSRHSPLLPVASLHRRSAGPAGAPRTTSGRRGDRRAGRSRDLQGFSGRR